MTLRDPKGYVTSPPSVVVRVIKTSRADINSLLGVVISYNVERERYLVYMAASQSTMALKQENLTKANRIDTYRCQWQQMRNDPRVREKVAYYISIARQFVSPFELSRVMSVVSISWFYLLFHFGFAKTMMVTSLTIIFLVVTAPDVMSKNHPSVICKNFPRRTKEMFEQQIPLLKGRMTERSAVLVILILSIICVRSLNAPKNPTDDSIQMSSSCRIEYDILKNYYDLGYEDGSNGHSRGTSMIPQSDSRTHEGVSPLDSEIIGSSLLEKIASMSRFASIVYVYQSVVELGIDQTTDLFSFGQLAANLQHHTKLWKKFVLLLCLYNILRVYV
mmetsp:Transcript_14639/g.35313  ORF Transcript_14639/g.35313 Transcript_14639/m.35313 type:complete len:333 (-) Transcript_14639:909-1907(-)